MVSKIHQFHVVCRPSRRGELLRFRQNGSPAAQGTTSWGRRQFRSCRDGPRAGWDSICGLFEIILNSRCLRNDKSLNLPETYLFRSGHDLDLRSIFQTDFFFRSNYNSFEASCPEKHEAGKINVVPLLSKKL